MCKQALIQARIYCACYVHAFTHSSLRILCKLCTCIHPLKPPHTLHAVYMHPSTQVCAYSARCVHASTPQACAYSASRVHSDPACKPACKSACGLCMQSLHVGLQAEKCMRMQSMHAEGAACRVCMYRTCRFACIIFMQNLQICMRIYACEE